MRTALMLLALLAAPALAGQTVWKWVDEKGVTHYSDQPVPGAQRVELATSSRPTTVNNDDSRNRASPGTQQSEPQFAGYRSFEITSPANDATVPNSGGVVEVSVRSDPALYPGHSMYLYYDGVIVRDFPREGAQYTLRDVPRGTHSLIVVIRDDRGNRVFESPTVNFHVRQESVANPPVGPSMRPPPKPQPRAQSKPLSSQPSYGALNGAPPKVDPRTNKPVRP